MWHLFMVHQQESFHPFPSLQGLVLSPSLLLHCLSCFLRRTAKRAPRPHGSTQNCVVPTPKAAAPGFKSQRQSSSAAPFLTPPIISYTCQHSRIFQPFLAAIVSPGRCGPVVWSEPSPSSHEGAVTRGSWLPVQSCVKVTPISLAQSKATAT